METALEKKQDFERLKLRKNRGWVLGWVGATAATQLQCSDFSLTEECPSDQAFYFEFFLKKRNE